MTETETTKLIDGFTDCIDTIEKAGGPKVPEWCEYTAGSAEIIGRGWSPEEFGHETIVSDDAEVTCPEAVICTLVCWAMDVGAWYESLDETNNVSVYYNSGDQRWLAVYSVGNVRGCDIKELAYLTVLQAICEELKKGSK